MFVCAAVKRAEDKKKTHKKLAAKSTVNATRFIYLIKRKRVKEGLQGFPPCLRPFFFPSLSRKQQHSRHPLVHKLEFNNNNNKKQQKKKHAFNTGETRTPASFCSIYCYYYYYLSQQRD